MHPLLRAGVGIETALEDISKQGGGPLNDELKRAVIEIKIGSTFDDALLSMGERLKSKTLDRTFRMILEGKRVGGSLSDVIETVAEDLRSVLALKRERKANVMMSVMFLDYSCNNSSTICTGYDNDILQFHRILG